MLVEQTVEFFSREMLRQAERPRQLRCVQTDARRMDRCLLQIGQMIEVEGSGDRVFALRPVDLLQIGGRTFFEGRRLKIFPNVGLSLLGETRRMDAEAAQHARRTDTALSPLATH